MAMLVRFQRLFAQCGHKRFLSGIIYSQISSFTPQPAKYTFHLSQSKLFSKRLCSLPKLHKRFFVSQHSEVKPNAAETMNEKAQTPLRDQPSIDAPRYNADPVPATSPANMMMRTSLVGTSVGLLTPLYVAAGAAYIWQTYKPSTVVGKAAKLAVGALFLGACCVNGWTFTTQHLLPFVFNHAEIVLPFALATAAVASVWYAIGESVFGLQRMAGNTEMLNAFRSLLPGRAASVGASGIPLGGPLVGFLTALTSFPLWEPFAHHFWPQELLNACDSSVLADVYLNFLPVGLGTGALVGLGLHFALAPVFTGRIHTFGSLPAAPSLLFVVLALTLAYFFFCRFDYDAWEQRLNVDSGEIFWAHADTGQKVAPPVRLLDDTLWFLKGVAFFCNMNSLSKRSHFNFANRQLLADALVLEAKLIAGTHGKPGTNQSLDQSKFLLNVHYGINPEYLYCLMVQLLRNHHDIQSCLSVTDLSVKADLEGVMKRCIKLQEDLVAQIRALGSNADAAVAIDHLLSNLPALELRLSTEAGQSFSEGSGAVAMSIALKSIVRSFTQPSLSSQNSHRKRFAFLAIAALGGFFVYLYMR
jgi:hypothetical protein